MHSHIFLPSTKKDVFYCKICNKLSYKDILCQNLPICHNYNRFNIDPLTLKFKPISYNYDNKVQNKIKYLELKYKGISKIEFLTKNFGLKSMIFYKSICFMNKIFLENEISLDNIDNVASLCVLLVTEFNEGCIPSIFEECLSPEESNILYHQILKNNSNKINNGNKIRHKLNLYGLFSYIKKNVNNFKFWELLCLKYLNYDLEKYSVYDYLILFFKLGIFFCEKEINIIEKLNYCLKILDLIVINKNSCCFNEYTFAMSIIKLAMGNDYFFDKKIFKYIYGVDLSKKKYINCSNFIKSILNISINNESSKLFFNNINNSLNFNQLNLPQIYYLRNILSQQNNNLFFGIKKQQNVYIDSNICNNNNNIQKEKIDHNNKNEINICNYNNLECKKLDFDQFKTPIVNNNNIIIHNNININNFDFNFFDNKYNNFADNNKIRLNNNHYFFNVNELVNNCIPNFQ
jgi:hypothetical protein